jgi:hypothetical protein
LSFGYQRSSSPPEQDQIKNFESVGALKELRLESNRVTPTRNSLGEQESLHCLCGVWHGTPGKGRNIDAFDPDGLYIFNADKAQNPS